MRFFIVSVAPNKIIKKVLNSKIKQYTVMNSSSHWFFVNILLQIETISVQVPLLPFHPAVLVNFKLDYLHHCFSWNIK